MDPELILCFLHLQSFLKSVLTAMRNSLSWKYSKAGLIVEFKKNHCPSEGVYCQKHWITRKILDVIVHDYSKSHSVKNRKVNNILS